MKILIIEDNRLLAESIKRQLDANYVVDIVSSGEEGIERAREIAYSVILLDLNLPGIDGHGVCYELRHARVNTPILVLSGVADTDSRVRLLMSGADDYVTKPFDSSELRARITALTRRGQYELDEDTINVGDLTIDVRRRRVVRGNIPITLRRKEFDILEYLAQNQGRAVTRTMIFNHVWETGQDGWNNTVDVHIKHLRDKVDRPFKTPLIKTAYGIGYMVDDAV
jgi:two-component system OmpR family response regulator